MSLEHLQGKPALVKHLTLLQRLAGVLETQLSCQGAAVGGSLATDSADHMSDVDLVVYCESGSARDLLRELSVVAETLPVVYRLDGQHDSSSVFEKVILQDWSSYEIHVIEPSTRMRLKSPYLELVNRDGYLETRRSEDKPIGRETLRPFVNGEAGLVWELFNCIKWLRRGDAGFTSQYLQQLGSALAERQNAR